MVGSLLLYPRGNAYYNIAYYEEKDNEYVLPLEPEAKQRGERIFDCTIPVSGEPTTLIITGTSVQPSGWMTDNASVLKVDRSGNLTPVSTGTAHITAFVGDAKVKCIIRVR